MRTAKAKTRLIKIQTKNKQRNLMMISSLEFWILRPNVRMKSLDDEIRPMNLKPRHWNVRTFVPQVQSART